MISVAKAETRILAGILPVGTERVGLVDAAGRVLAQDIVAQRTHPPRDVSAMDGYAGRAGDLTSIPARVTVAMRIQAGETPPRALGRGEAARIFTGAALPDGADTIVIQENTKADGGAVIILEAASRGAHIRVAGYDFRAGDVLLTKGLRLSPAACGLIAAANLTTIDVYRRPRVALLATGDELVPPGVTPQGAQIIASTAVALAGQLAQWGAEATDLGIAPDREDAIGDAAARSLDHDVLVTQGGASVGDADLVKPALMPLGLEVDFWKIAMRPGKPLMFGRIARTAVIGLPGNPVSALVCARLFLEPLVRVLGGESWAGHRLIDIELGASLAANDQRQDYLRAHVTRDGGRLVATPFALQDSGNLSTFARSDALILRSPHAGPVDKGATVQALPLSSWL